MGNWPTDYIFVSLRAQVASFQVSSLLSVIKDVVKKEKSGTTTTNNSFIFLNLYYDAIFGTIAFIKIICIFISSSVYW